MVTFILCMRACYSGQANDKPHALGVKFNLSKGFMRCILDTIFFQSGIFLLAISHSMRATFTVGEANVDCKIGWRDPRLGFPRFWAPDCLRRKGSPRTIGVP